MPDNILQNTAGLLLFDKPGGISSHDAVYLLRKKLGIKKIGHGGTLDPLATGLLILLVGRATRMQDKLQTGSKVYSGTVKFGTETDTWDTEGKVVKTSPLPEMTEEKISEVLNRLEGCIEQQVPPFSAVKYKGEKLYKIAREGRETPVIMRKVYVHWINHRIIMPDTLFFRVEVSGGTYIRTLARDIGRLSGSCAYMSSLRREAVGNYSVNQAITVETLKAVDREDIIARLIPVHTPETKAGNEAGVENISGNV